MVSKILGVPPGDWGHLLRKDMKKTIKIELTREEINILINGLTVRALSDNLDEEDKALGRKLSKAEKELENQK
tara:strand:+ start:785 stop:1003 length:219 start_codon:yes stop_codon:yes gene_type:complete